MTNASNVPVTQRRPTSVTVNNAAQPWTRPNVVSFYSGHRRTLGDLYPSEAYFLPRLIRPGLQVLDVGCAAGGFSGVLRELQPDVQYTGVDISKAMIAEARRSHPDGRFAVSPAEQLPFRDGAFELVLCTGGTLPMILNWRTVLQECWRVTRQRMLFDVRVVGEGQDQEDVSRSYIKMAFAGEWDGSSVAPYVVITMSSLHRAVMSLKPEPREISGYGYHHSVSDMAVTSFREVCMTTLCVGKGPAGSGCSWEVPLPWPDEGDHKT